MTHLSLKQSSRDINIDFQRRSFVALRPNGWENVTFERICFVLNDSSAIDDEPGLSPVPLHLLAENEIITNIERPLIFVILPDDRADHYNFTKMCSHFLFGVMTQCVIANKYESQRDEKNKDQFCSNVAIKVNAKLSNTTNQAQTWSTACDGTEGIHWIQEAPTFVMGLSISNTLGQHANSIIGGSVCLDKYCMRLAQEVKVQTKTEMIDGTILVDLTKSLLMQYYIHNQNQIPKRMLIYRGKS